MPEKSSASRGRGFWLGVGAAAGAGLLLILGAVGGLAFMYSGIYSVGATGQHTGPVYWILTQGMRYSVRRHSADVRVPDLSDPALVRAGFRCFHDNCVQCHGAPGIPPGDIGKSMTPIPASLVQTAREWPAAELYWVTKHGIKMAGMPAWEFRIAERDIWGIVAFLQVLPELTVPEYRGLVENVELPRCSRPHDEDTPVSAERGKLALKQYACHGCHKIPGVVGPDVYVGPPLTRYAQRKVIAGVLPNTRENLIRWIVAPQEVSPLTLMPDLDVTEAHARDMAAYLATLE